MALQLRLQTPSLCVGGQGATMCLTEVSLELSVSADVKRNAMRPATQHFRVAQSQRNDIKTLLFQ